MNKPFNILVADKNRNVRDFLRRELLAEGYEVAVVDDGGRILDKVKNEIELDLLVFDLEMPNANSSVIFETARCRVPPLPVVVHTFLTEECERSFVFDAGNTYIEKSGNIDHLKAAIADTLKRFYVERFAGSNDE